MIIWWSLSLLWDGVLHDGRPRQRCAGRKAEPSTTSRGETNIPSAHAQTLLPNKISKWKKKKGKKGGKKKQFGNWLTPISIPKVTRWLSSPPCFPPLLIQSESLSVTWHWLSPLLNNFYIRTFLQDCIIISMWEKKKKKGETLDFFGTYKSRKGFFFLPEDQSCKRRVSWTHRAGYSGNSSSIKLPTVYRGILHLQAKHRQDTRQKTMCL